MKNKLLVIASISLLLLSSCKKSGTTNKGGISSQQNASTSNGFPASGTGSINGVLYAQHFVVPSYSVSYYSAGAMFSKTATPFSSLYTSLGIQIGYDPVGVLKIDTTILQYNSTYTNSNINMYTDSANTSNYSTVKWNIGGNANFNAFTTNVTRGYPAIANTNYLPHGFSKSQPLTINFGTNYTNTDSIIVMITDNAYPNPFIIYRYLAGNTNSVTFTVAQLSGASTSNNPQINISAKNYSNLSNANKNYIFIMENDLIQYITIAP